TAAPDEPQPPGLFLRQLADRQTMFAAATVAAGSAGQTAAWHSLVGLCAGATPPFDFWDLDNPFANPTGRTQLGACTLILSGFGGADSALGARLNALALLKAGDEIREVGGFDCWTLIDTDQVRRVRKTLLARIRHGAPLPDPQAFDLELDAY